MKTFRALSAVPLGLALAGVAVVSPAFASGGKDIASAPLVAYGQQEFGNTAIDSPEDDCPGGDSWWTLAVASGDRITIDYEGAAEVESVFPIGTSDFNVEDTSAYQYSYLASNGKQEAKFTAPATGMMPLDFLAGTCMDEGEPGPYDFTAYVTHGVALAMTHFRSVKHMGTIVVSARTPDGGLINDQALSVDVQMKRGSHWATIGSAPVLNSLATVHLSIPKRLHPKRITLRARDHGAGYLTRTSAHRTVKLRPLKKHHKRHH